MDSLGQRKVEKTKIGDGEEQWRAEGPAAFHSRRGGRRGFGQTSSRAPSAKLVRRRERGWGGGGATGWM